MNEHDYKENIARACRYERDDWGGFWRGYRKGLRRAIIGESFGSEEEHELWMEKANSDIESVKEHGLGYRAGFAKKDAEQLFSVRGAMKNVSR